MAKKAKKCRCVEKVNAQLEAVGAKLTQYMKINFTTGKGEMSPPCVEVHRADKSKRGKIPAVLCAFCPFCGIKLTEK